jgi:rSAM/selenodomain-associated transferase 1
LKTVCLILKCPRVGEVKTRLANEIGAEQATMIYRLLVERQAAEIPSAWEVTVYFTPADAEEEMKYWLKPHLRNGVRFLPQVDGDLGQRLAMVVQTEFARGCERIFLIGGDCPGLSTNYLHQANTALDTNDVVIGPAQDGGYVLLGLKPLDRLGADSFDRHAPSWSRGLDGLFANIAWSSSAVLEQTLLAARNQNLSVRLLHSLADIDEVADLNDQFELIQALIEERPRSSG